MSGTDRINELNRLRYLGDFYYNKKVLSTGGNLIVARRPKECLVIDAKWYTPCPYCLGWFKKSGTALSRHPPLPQQ